MARIIKKQSTTFDEWLLEPRETTQDHTHEKIVLRTPLASFNRGEESRFYLNTPFLSAAMQSVTGPKLAIALAREGGLGVIYCSQSIKAEEDMVCEVKNHKAGFVPSDSNLAPHSLLEDAINLSDKTGHSTIAITHDGTPKGTLLGILTDNDYWIEFDDPKKPVNSFMTSLDNLIFGKEGASLSEANRLLWEKKISCLPIISADGRLVSLVFKKDYKQAKQFPISLVDEQKRYRVGAALNTHDFMERAPALLDAGADVLVFDSSDGFSSYQKNAIEWIKKTYPESIVCAGNVVNREGFQFLVDAGADVIKIWICGGSICTTRPMKALGRGQADAVMDIAKGRDKHFAKDGRYIPLISDGGIVQDSHIILALAMGADAVMMGRYFAQTDESPTPVVPIKGQFVKPYWGEGSARARNWQRYQDSASVDWKFEEGIDGYVPLAGSLGNKVRLTSIVLKDLMGHCGVSNIEEFHERATLRRVSPATLKESAPHDVLRFEYTLRDRDTWG